MIRSILIFLLLIATSHADECRWDSDAPCLTITKTRTSNSNALGDRISPTFIITKNQIQKNNLIDLPKVLNFVQGMDVTQSGPRGQQTSIFLRGTNSNHTLVLLNGVPINDYSTPTGAFDAGQDFMSNVVQVNVYKGTAGAHWGADAIGGAINLITAVDYENRLAVSGSSSSGNVQANVYERINDWDISLSLGRHEAETESALAGAGEKDGVENTTVGVNASKHFTDKLEFTTNLMHRNTFADIDGHTLAIQEGKWSDNTFYALQAGLDYNHTGTDKTSLTLHTHEYDRDYDDAHYESNTYMVRAQHQTQSWGLGIDYKADESLTSNHDNVGYFFNTSYQMFSYHYRQDREHESYKVGVLQPLSDSLTIRGNHATGYKNKTTWGALEFSDSQEMSLDYNNFTTTVFRNDIGNINTDGLELSYGSEDFRIFGSRLNAKNGDTVLTRRPEWNLGFMHNHNFVSNWSLTTNYKYKGKHLDIHNTTWNTISMPETHLIDLNLSKNWHGIDIGFSLTNLFDEDYQAPHGFSQDGRRIEFGFKRIF